MSRDGRAAPTLLVAGGTRVDAGKTTFSTGLLARLASEGVKSASEPGTCVGVKPRAGNDFWFDHDDVRIATDRGRLYGKDARRLASTATCGPVADIPDGPTETDRAPVSSDAVTPESINPIHRLWRPTPGRTGLLGESDRTFLVDRVTGENDTQFVVNGAAESAGLLPDTLVNRLPLADAPRVHDVQEFNDLMAERYVPALDALAARVEATRDCGKPVVLESYGDVALPLAVDIDAVAVVEPTRARVYASDRYGKAREVAAGSAREGSLEEHTDAVTGMIEPLATIGLPALPGDVRAHPKKVADAYSEAYDALLDAV